MKLQSSASGEEVNWINYKTGIKELYFKTDVDNKSARIAIEISLKDREMQELMFEENWPEIIGFLKENLLKLDEFWDMVRDSFEIFK